MDTSAEGVTTDSLGRRNVSVRPSRLAFLLRGVELCLEIPRQ